MVHAPAYSESALALSSRIASAGSRAGLSWTSARSTALTTVSTSRCASAADGWLDVAARSTPASGAHSGVRRPRSEEEEEEEEGAVAVAAAAVAVAVAVAAL